MAGDLAFSLTITRGKSGLWMLCSDELRGLIIHGHSLQEVLSMVVPLGDELLETMRSDKMYGRQTESGAAQQTAFERVFVA